MKHLLFSLLTLGLLATAQARTWTSADGKNFFAGIYLRSDDTSVTVFMQGKEATFKLTLISEEDRAWAKAEGKRLTEAENKTAPEKPSLDDQYLGKKLKGNTANVTGDQFNPTNTTKVPEYYFFYYSASW